MSTHGSEHEVIVDGVRVALSSVGTGVPVLFMHGNPDSRHSWEPLFRELGPGFRLIAPDFPGFGDSSPLPPGASFGPEAMASFWGRFVDAVVPEPSLHVVVHDFGGPWLLPWVATHRARVRSLGVLNTVYHGDYRWHAWARVWQTPLLGEAAVLLARRAMLRREMRRHAPGVPRELVDATYDRMHATMRRTVLRTYRAYRRPHETIPAWEKKLMASLEGVPMAVVWGDRDPYIPARYADRFGVVATHLPDCGHWLHLQQPAVVAEHLRALWAAGGGSSRAAGG